MSDGRRDEDEIVSEATTRPNDDRHALRVWVAEARRARTSEMEQAAEIERLKADNAALLQAVNEVLNFVDMWNPDMGGKHKYRLTPGHGPAVARLQDVAAPPHPGAALLKERQEQADTIKALADALVDCHSIAALFNRRSDAMWAACEDAVVAALRLAGRLP